MTDFSGLTRAPRRYTSVDLNREHGLVQGLQSFVTGDTCTNLVTGGVVNPTSGSINNPIVATPYGMGLTSEPTVSNWLTGQFKSPVFAGGAIGATVMACANPLATTSPYYLIQVYDPAGTGSYMSLIVNITGPGSPVAGCFASQVYQDHTFTTSQSIDSNSAIPIYSGVGFHIYSASHVTNNVAHIYFDGVNLGQSCLGNVVSVSATSAAQGPGLCSGVPVVWSAIWSRVLSDAEHFSMARNPWQIFVA